MGSGTLPSALRSIRPSRSTGVNTPGMASDARTFNPKLGFEERLARQAAFVAMVKALPKTDAAAAQAQISAFIIGLEKSTEYGTVSRRELMQLIATTSQIATPAQRAAAKVKLLDYADTFEGLSRGR